LHRFTKDFFHKKYPLLFVDKTSRINILIDEHINIILSPSFYWVRKEELPVKSAYAAKKLVASIFEPILPEGNYSYHVVKRDGFFELFAYDDVFIVSTLEAKGIKSSQINAIYFIQNEIETHEKSLGINESVGMLNTNGIWSVLPAQYLHNSLPIEDILKKIEHPKEKISIDIFKNFVLEESQLSKIIASFVALMVIYGVEHWNLKQEFSIASIIQYKIMDDYTLPKTSMQLEGLKRDLLAEEKSQTLLRQEIKQMLALPLLEGERWSELNVKKNTIALSITLKDPKRAEELKKIIAQKSQISSIKVVDTTMHVEVKL
jgi:hypothetical protein